MVRMTEEDLDALRAAAATLEHPGLAARLGNIAGKPIELVGRALPEATSKAVAAATTKSTRSVRPMEKDADEATARDHRAGIGASTRSSTHSRRDSHHAHRIDRAWPTLA